MTTATKEKPLLSVFRAPWRLRVWYEPGRVPVYRVEVDHIREAGLWRRETVPCFHEPLWGIDAEDMQVIRETAEAMTQELEIELGEEDRWASLR